MRAIFCFFFICISWSGLRVARHHRVIDLPTSRRIQISYENAHARAANVDISVNEGGSISRISGRDSTPRFSRLHRSRVTLGSGVFQTRTYQSYVFFFVFCFSFSLGSLLHALLILLINLYTITSLFLFFFFLNLFSPAL